MVTEQRVDQFSLAARNIGAEVFSAGSLSAAAAYVAERVRGRLLLPAFASGERCKLGAALSKAGVSANTRRSEM